MKRPRRILMTVDAVGGVWRYALDAAAALRNEAIETVLVGQGPKPDGEQEAEARSCGVADLIWLDEPLDWMASDEAELDPSTRRLAELALSLGIDLLHLNAPSQAAGLAVDVPVLVMSHSCVVTWWRAMRADPLPDAWAWKRRRNMAGFAAADGVLAPSASHRDALRSVYGPIDGLRVVHNASAGRSGEAPKEDFVLAAGRWWDEAKNGAVLDRTAPDIGWPVLMAGATQGPNGRSANFRNAEALGETGAAALGRLMERAAVFVSPSLYEPFGLAVLEAASAGCALVLADIPVFREIWSDAAMFFDPRDPAALAAAINDIAADPDKRRRLTVSARERAGQFTTARQARALCAAYADASRSRTRKDPARRSFAAGAA